MSNSNDGYVYCLYDATNGICKIGKTNRVTQGCRIKSQAGYYPFPLETLKVYFRDFTSAETHLHRVFKEVRLNGEWFKISVKDFKREATKYKKSLPIKPKTEKVKAKKYVTKPYYKPMDLINSMKYPKRLDEV